MSRVTQQTAKLACKTQNIEFVHMHSQLYERLRKDIYIQEHSNNISKLSWNDSFCFMTFITVRKYHAGSANFTLLPQDLQSNQSQRDNTALLLWPNHYLAIFFILT